MILKNKMDVLTYILAASFIFSFFWAPAVSASRNNAPVAFFSNLEYPLEGAPGGKITLKKGTFSAPIMEGAASKFEAKLLPTVATGSWKGKTVAAVVIAYSQGGSGNFRRLYFLVNEKNTWQPKAWTNLGDRIRVRYLGLDHHGEIIVGMITHGPEDSQCCPAKRIVRTYIIRKDKILPVKTAATEIFPDEVHFSPQGLNGDIRAVLVPELGFSAHGLTKEAPYPSHVALILDGKKILRVFPTDAYRAMWLKHKDLTIQIAVKRIERIIEKRSHDLSPPLPILPPRPGLNDMAARVELVPLKDGGGIGFVGRITKKLSCVTASDLKYFFSGTSNHGKFLVSFEHDVLVGKIPRELWACDNNVEGLKQQIEKITGILNGMREGDFSPSLRDLKAFLSSVYIQTDTI